MKFVRLTKSHLPDKKFDALLQDEKGTVHHIPFGATGYSDYPTYHKGGKVHAELRKFAYLTRHRTREDWTKSGLLTPGFWSRWILWNKPTVDQSLQDTLARFDL